MDAKADKPHRIRVRTLDGKPRDRRDLNKLKSDQLRMPHLDIVPTATPSEFIILAKTKAHLEGARTKLNSVGLEEVVGGDTTIAASASPKPTSTKPTGRGSFQQQGSSSQRGNPSQRSGGSPHSRGGRGATGASARPLPGKPYGFVALPKNFESAPPVWLDGTSSAGRLSGEIRFELTALTPLLVGWERGQVGDSESDWPVPSSLPDVGQLADNKSVLCPLRAPWGKRPAVIPGDSLKGLLRHELGALLGAPMERVAERSYSYRPNLSYPNASQQRLLVPRLARVLDAKVCSLGDGRQVRVPTEVELFPDSLQYNKKARKFDYRFDAQRGQPYRGGQGAGQELNSKVSIHTSLEVLTKCKTEVVQVPQVAQVGYLATIRHLTDLDHGHFSPRHPDVPGVVTGEQARKRILEAAAGEVFQPGDLIWVEWDTEKKCIVSFGWHYYYRWAYVDTVRRDADAPNGERHGLFPLLEERAQDGDGAPVALSAVRRLLGYTGDNEGSAGIGEDDHAQLMGRISINAALEVVSENETDAQRFLRPTFLKELGMPRPSAVEFYLKQPDHPRSRPSDQATLVTYGDAAGYDEPGELAGRKFYLDRPDAYSREPWEDRSQENRANERSTLALEASRPGRKFRFTLRFRDLDPHELAAILVALCPDQFKQILGGTHPDGYCSKLGYARPLGWGSVRIEAKGLFLLDALGDTPDLEPVADILDWVKQSHRTTETQDVWLAIHRHKHPDAADYPREADRQGNENIYTFHTTLRAEHARARRYRKEENR